MRIMVTRDWVELGGYPVETYSASMVRVLREKGHEVIDTQKDVNHRYHDIDLLIDVDCGRNRQGELVWQGQERKPNVKSAVMFIDALDLNTPILTTKGWKTMGDITAGMEVFSPEGTPVVVVDTTVPFIDRKCYELEFDSGEKIVSDKDHRWAVIDRGKSLSIPKSEHKILTTEEMYKSLTPKGYRYHIPVAKGIKEFTKDNSSKLLDPYCLGVWLGDGAKSNARVTVAKTDHETLDKIGNSFTVKGMDNYPFEFNIGRNKNNTPFRTLLIKWKLLDNKHIPSEYFVATYEERLSLLQGLMDSDGECAKDGQCYFHNKDRQLILQVKELVDTLGLKSYIRTHIRKGSGYCAHIDQAIMHRLSFKAPKSVPVFNLARKHNRQVEALTRTTSMNHRIIAIRPIESRAVKCLSVDSKARTFLAGRALIPTHNSHGYPSLHKRLASNYDHVFFAVYDRRDLFTKHPSAHWCPNFSDLKWFDGKEYPVDEETTYDFGFYGSKGGLSRADKLVEIANDKGYTVDVRQVNAGGKHRWPQTAEAMSNCHNLFNHQQKHDGPNLRVMESMLMNRPLICDQDPRSGMDKLFEPWVHYIPYDSYTYQHLKDAMHFAVNSPVGAQEITENAYNEVKAKHLVEHRIDQILEVVNV